MNPGMVAEERPIAWMIGLESATGSDSAMAATRLSSPSPVADMAG